MLYFEFNKVSTMINKMLFNDFINVWHSVKGMYLMRNFMKCFYELYILSEIIIYFSINLSRICSTVDYINMHSFISYMS